MSAAAPAIGAVETVLPTVAKIASKASWLARVPPPLWVALLLLGGLSTGGSVLKDWVETPREKRQYEREEKIRSEQRKAAALELAMSERQRLRQESQSDADRERAYIGQLGSQQSASETMLLNALASVMSQNAAMPDELQARGMMAQAQQSQMQDAAQRDTDRLLAMTGSGSGNSMFDRFGFR